MEKEEVSIIIPTYNRADSLKKSVASVLEQTYPWFELIIVDDGSTDNTKELVESFGDNRIRYYYAGLNQGAAAARNYGLENSFTTGIKKRCTRFAGKPWTYVD